MICPGCRASNPDGAPFCGQCYTRFDPPAPAEPTDAPAAPQAAPPGGAPVVAPVGGIASPERRDPTQTATAGRFTAVEGRLVWSCAVCGSDNEVEDFSCAVCGTRMDAEGDRAAEVDWAAARRAEALVPGLGHVRAGRAGMGLARGAMVGLWLLGALGLALGGATGIATALPLVVGAAVVWATGPGDVDAIRTGREPRLDPRGFMYVVIGVTLGVIVAGGLALVL